MRKSIAALGIIALSLSLPGCAAHQGGPQFVKQDDNTCRDTIHGLVWQRERSNLIDSLEEAEAYVAELNQKSAYHDWRLPTIYELYDLNYAFDLHQNGDCAMAREGNYWAGKKDGDGMVGAWEIGNQCDPERQYFPGKKGFVRAVRP